MLESTLLLMNSAVAMLYKEIDSVRPFSILECRRLHCTPLVCGDMFMRSDDIKY